MGRAGLWSLLSMAILLAGTAGCGDDAVPTPDASMDGRTDDASDVADAGPDAPGDGGAADGGTADAGGTDAAFDAGVDAAMDASADSGPTDAGGTDGGTEPVTGVCSSDGWCWDNPVPQGNDLDAVWAAPSGSVWAAGDTGTMLRWDGSAWAAVDTPATHALHGLWGVSGDDIWAAGFQSLLHYDGSAWTASDAGTSDVLWDVWGTATDDVWAVGRDGVVLRYDGDVWTTIDAGTTSQLNAVWGSGSDDVWAVGRSNTVVHFDGSSWETVSLPDPTPDSGWDANIDVWGSGADDVYIAATEALYHYDGSAWSVRDAGSSVGYRAVRGDGPSNVWVAGRDGIVRHWDGATWSDAYDAGSEVSALGISGTTVVAVGPAGHIWRRASSGWADDSRGSRRDFEGLWATGPDDLYAVSGGATYHFDGAEWTEMPDSPGGADIWAAGPDHILVVSTYGSLWRYDGSGWTSIELPSPKPTFPAIWGASESNVFVAGRDGEIVHWDGSSWTHMTTGTTEHFEDLWGSGPDDVFAVGWDVLLHYDGASWSTMPSAGSDWRLDTVWGSGPDDVWVGGDRLARYDGSAWTEVTGGPFSAQAIHGTGPNDVWAYRRSGFAGDPAELHHYDGSGWTEMLLPTNRNLTDLWFTDTTFVVAGNLGALLRSSR